MKEVLVAGKKGKGEPASEKKGLRGKIKSDFPKHSLEEAMRVPRALYEANGGQPLPPTETAIALGMSPGSSDFRVLLSSSIKYGLSKGSFNSERVSMEPLALKILEPKNPEEARGALVEATLTPETFRAIYDYFRGKKLPEATFFQNTVVREFGVPREHAERCVSIFNANIEHVKLVRVASTGRWLSTELLPQPGADSAAEQAEDDEVSQEEQGVLPPELAARLGEPTPPPNAIFLGHGKSKRPLEQLKTLLDQYKIPYKIAVDEPNQFRPISQKVAETMKSCGAAILIFTADEELRDPNGEVVWRPSENVVYELGAASVLYGNRIIIFKEEGVTFPSNFRDIGYIGFDEDALSAKTNELFKELIAFSLIKVIVGS
jgi:predicted nucleotide-binding protein